MELLGGTRHAKCAQMSEWVTDHVCATVPTVRLMDGLGYTTNQHTNQQKVYQKWDFAMQLYQLPAKAGGGITDSEINWCFERRETQSIGSRRQPEV